jgi:putative hydrolase of the HAD superfamily
VPLLFLDLDDTLLDRAGAFRRWAEEFLDDVGAPGDDLEWLVALDADGLTSRWDVADAIRDKYRLRVSSLDLVEALHQGVLDYLQLDRLVAGALRIATDAGWVPVVVTNGAIDQQEAMIKQTGLDRHIVDWVISERAGVSKPNPRIFALAAQRVRMRLHGAWIVGDCPETDIGGAAAMGLPSVWLHRGRRWIDSRYRPTHIVDGLLAAVAAVMDGPEMDRGGGRFRPYAAH